MDTLIEHALVFTMTGGGVGAIDDAAVGVTNGQISYVGPTDEIDADASEVLDGRDRLVMPGLVDAHAHMGLTLLRGGAQDVPEIEWMHQTLGPLAAHMDRDDELAGAKLGAVEAIMAGTTTICEYASGVGDLLEAVYDPFGVRVVAAETINELPDGSVDPDDPPEFDRTTGASALDRTDALAEQYAGHDRIDIAYAPQAVDMVSPETLADTARRAERHDRDVHVHVAQGERERRTIEARYGTEETAVSRLSEAGLVSDRLVAAHLHGAGEEGRAQLADAGARMVGCPSSIAAIDGVTSPMLEYAEHGGSVGFGTDQAPATGRHDVLREARTAALLLKTDRADPRALPAWKALRMATIGGARALGIADRAGTIEPGKRADLAIVDLKTGGMVPSVSDPLHTAAPNLLYAAAGTAVTDVMVEGQLLVTDSKFMPADARKIRQRAAERARDVFTAGADDWCGAGSALARDAATDRL